MKNYFAFLNSVILSGCQSSSAQPDRLDTCFELGVETNYHSLTTVSWRLSTLGSLLNGKPNIMLQELNMLQSKRTLVLGLIISLILYSFTLDAQNNAQIIEMEFERELSIEEQLSVNVAITQRLKAGKIKFRGNEFIDNQNWQVGIRSGNDIDMAMQLLTHQGLFSIMEVFDNAEIINTLIGIDEELRFDHGLEISILDYLVLIDPHDENLPLMNAKTVIGFCNPSDTNSLNQLLTHPGVRAMLPRAIAFR